MSQIIRIENLSKRFPLAGGDIEALVNVSFTISKGEFVSVMGPSGSGKSTLMNVLGLLDRPTAGHYILDGANVSCIHSDHQARVRRDNFGFVFQSFNLLSQQNTIENVELPLIYAGIGKAERRRRAESALGDVGLIHRKHQRPNQLSGGEQQRVAIARALINDPRIIFADEPTGALDSRMGTEILALFQSLNHAGKTIVLVTHDMTVAHHTNRIITLDDGRVVGDKDISNPLTATQDASTSTLRAAERINAVGGLLA